MTNLTLREFKLKYAERLTMIIQSELSSHSYISSPNYARLTQALMLFLCGDSGALPDEVSRARDWGKASRRVDRDIPVDTEFTRKSSTPKLICGYLA